MEKKHGKWIALGVVALIAVLAWPTLQWFRFELEVRDAIGDKQLGRFPTAEQVVGFPATLKTLAAAKGFAELDVHLTLQPVARGPVTFWHLIAEMRSGSHSFKTQRRLESGMDDDYFETLREGGVTVHEPTDDGDSGGGSAVDAAADLLGG